jgi:hypothetical protein
MQLIDRNRRVRRLASPARRHPELVAPACRFGRRDNRGRGGWRLTLARDRVGFPRQGNAAGPEKVILMGAGATRGTNSSQIPAL